MAKAFIPIDQLLINQFKCPICLELLKDPVATPCGHSFCKECINGYWDQEDHRGTYSCPQCRRTFTQRPNLWRNTILTKVLEKLKETDNQAAPPAHCYAGPEDVECDFCTERKRKAIKSCLMCLTSFCETHLKTHYERPALKKHTLVEPRGDLQDKICSQHDKLMEIYCRTDERLICLFCLMEEHRGHDIVTAKAERTEKERELMEKLRRTKQRIQEKQNKVEELKQAVIQIKSRSQTAVQQSEKIFTEMISSIEKRLSEVRQLIRNQNNIQVSKAEDLLQELEQDITDLQRRVNKLEELSQIPDHIHFLQSFSSFPAISKLQDLSIINVNQRVSFERVIKSLSDLKNQVEEVCTKKFTTISSYTAAVQILPKEPQIKKDFLLYFCKLTLDPNTANNHLILSENNSVVRWSESIQSYPDHPERFTLCKQVLCEESVCGRCYWEVEWSGDVVGISVSYKEISMKGGSKESMFGLNPHSWSLWCSSSSLFFFHNKIRTVLKDPPCSRIGVYVDHSAGTLSFYSVSNTIKLLHRVHTTFTQPLYAGFGFINGSVRLCNPE